MKVIFLDMDGVLNNRNSMAMSAIFGIHPRTHVGGIYTVDPTCVKLLECLVAVSGAKIVVSSSWRGRTRETTQNVRNAFEWAGAPELWNQVIDVTPQHADRFRGREIDEWLKLHGRVTNFVVLDDDSFDITQKDNFVHVPGKIGLTFEHIEKAWLILGGPEDMRRSTVEAALGRCVQEDHWLEHFIDNLSRSDEWV